MTDTPIKLMTMRDTETVSLAIRDTITWVSPEHDQLSPDMIAAVSTEMLVAAAWD